MNVFVIDFWSVGVGEGVCFVMVVEWVMCWGRCISYGYIFLCMVFVWMVWMVVVVIVIVVEVVFVWVMVWMVVIVVWMVVMVVFLYYGRWVFFVCFD